MSKKPYFYHVQTPTSEHIIEANTQSAAVNHVVRGTIKVRNLTASELMYLMRDKGLKPETAIADAAEPAAAQHETKEQAE